MARAIELAQIGVDDDLGGPFGCVIVKDGEIIGEGNNQVTSTNDPTAHAEVVAIREACKNLNSFQLDGCIIYTSCEPCPMCLGAIYWARPRASSSRAIAKMQPKPDSMTLSSTKRSADRLRVSKGSDRDADARRRPCSISETGSKSRIRSSISYALSLRILRKVRDRCPTPISIC